MTTKGTALDGTRSLVESAMRLSRLDRASSWEHVAAIVRNHSIDRTDEADSSMEDEIKVESRGVSVTP